MIVLCLVAVLLISSCEPKNPAVVNPETATVSIDTLEKGDLRISVNGVSFVMKLVDGGTFMMGAQNKNPNEPNYDSEAYDDEIAFSATVRSYYIGETEVKQTLWNAVMNDNRYESQGNECGDNYPANYLWWYRCQDFIQKLNDLTEMEFRLPSEAEWEFAARGGDYSKGFKYAGSDDLGEVAWTEEIHEVKTKAPNELGLYDMSGNVSELCQDRYVIRGSFMPQNEYRCRVTSRTELTPDFPLNRFIGFRLAFSVENRPDKIIIPGPVFEGKGSIDSEVNAVTDTKVK